MAGEQPHEAGYWDGLLSRFYHVSSNMATTGSQWQSLKATCMAGSVLDTTPSRPRSHKHNFSHTTTTTHQQDLSIPVNGIKHLYLHAHLGPSR